MNVLVACEFSGIVREAFRKRGYNAWSCDLLESEIPSKYHIRDDVLHHLHDGWDMMIAHPPCTYLAVSGARWFKERQSQQVQALDFVSVLMNAPIEKIVVENPISVISTKIRKPDQIIHPYQFGHAETKTTCLWLKNLPKLIPTKIIKPLVSGVHKFAGNNSLHSLDRSRTYPGIADAMAEQWGTLREDILA